MSRFIPDYKKIKKLWIFVNNNIKNIKNSTWANLQQTILLFWLSYHECTFSYGISHYVVKYKRRTAINGHNLVCSSFSLKPYCIKWCNDSHFLCSKILEKPVKTVNYFFIFHCLLVSIFCFQNSIQNVFKNDHK